MAHKLLELRIVLAEISKAEADLAFIHATGAQPLPGTPSVACLEAVVSLAKATYMQQLRELSPSERDALAALI
jgi:hypothetical protein